jgi:hypothetical protein
LFGFSSGTIKNWYFDKRPGYDKQMPPKDEWLREKRWVVETWKFGVDGVGQGGRRRSGGASGSSGGRVGGVRGRRDGGDRGRSGSGDGGGGDGGEEGGARKRKRKLLDLLHLDQIPGRVVLVDDPGAANSSAGAGARAGAAVAAVRGKYTWGRQSAGTGGPVYRAVMGGGRRGGMEGVGRVNFDRTAGGGGGGDRGVHDGHAVTASEGGGGDRDIHDGHDVTATASGDGRRRHLLHAVRAERHCMHQLAAARLITVRT